MRPGYVMTRLAQAALVLWAAWTLSFVVLYLLPGDPVRILASGGLENPDLDPARLAQLRADLGFDRPIALQYLTHLADALQGDLGRSITSGQPVVEVIARAIPVTLPLALASLAVAVPVALTIGLLANAVRARWAAELAFSTPALIVSVPTFWLGLVLLQLFSFRWHLFPAASTDSLAGLVLPAVTLGLPNGAILGQVFARSLSQTLAEPYVQVAIAKGLRRSRVIVAHALRNALIPTLTVLGLVVGNTLAGSVIVETVFARPGLGRLIARAVTVQDIPVVQGAVLLGAVVFVLTTLVVDLLYPLIDPRIAHTAPAGTRS
ncbi:ABC transporter permease [Phytohabitans suffuscus]|uniref:Peptide ABC transporter permease n=1 Tax=Phytohabitans suffuscus TaxID=624315 RepID=A0A6F8YFI0_9ACTN|nr:ABC transporter permease [Phytohabitans suffuscus]BCB84769.1 peptide ABC transporter permease [Phytohabitans suffuscus]